MRYCSCCGLYTPSIVCLSLYFQSSCKQLSIRVIAGLLQRTANEMETMSSEWWIVKEKLIVCLPKNGWLPTGPCSSSAVTFWEASLTFFFFTVRWDIFKFNSAFPLALWWLLTQGSLQACYVFISLKLTHLNFQLGIFDALDQLITICSFFVCV